MIPGNRLRLARPDGAVPVLAVVVARIRILIVGLVMRLLHRGLRDRRQRRLFLFLEPFVGDLGTRGGRLGIRGLVSTG